MRNTPFEALGGAGKKDVFRMSENQTRRKV